MPFYRMDGGGWVHINFGRKGGPAQCVAPALEGDDVTKFGPRCARMSVALCDGPVGEDLGGKPLTCDAPMCEKHRTLGGKNIDYCPRHKELAKCSGSLFEA